MHMLRNHLIIGTFIIFPFVLQAQAGISELVGKITAFIQQGVVTLTGLAIVAFLWNVLMFFIHSKNEEKKSQAKKFMVYGIITIAVLVSVWGLVGLISETLGTESSLNLPDLN